MLRSTRAPLLSLALLALCAGGPAAGARTVSDGPAAGAGAFTSAGASARSQSQPAASAAARSPSQRGPVASAAAAPQVRLSARFQPERLGRETTLRWGFAVSEPLPLRSMLLRLPAGMGFASSSLGLESCSPARLAATGPSGCPADSRIGLGSALAELPSETTVRESAAVTALMGPRPEEGMTVLFFLDARWPIDRQIVLASSLLHLTSPHGASLVAEVPQLPAWPSGPDIELSRFASTIGPQGLTYYRRARGRTIAFSPRGLTLPRRCPRGGFPISATFSWWTLPGSLAARTRVPCPKQGG